MSVREEWPDGPVEVTGPRTLDVDAAVNALRIRVYGGTVNVVGSATAERTRIEIGELKGPPLTVSYDGGTLTVGYDDLPWRGLLQFLGRKGWQRDAVVSVTVPAAARVEVGTGDASVVLSGVTGRTELRGVSGDTTLVRLTGPVRSETVTGRVEAQAVTGDLRFQSVSGDLTVIDGGGSSVRAESVTGGMVVDLDPAAKGTDVHLTTVSGEVAIRLPDPADAEVDASTTSGRVSNAFDDLRVGGQWGTKSITGRLGAGTGRLKVTTVSGSLALLRRPRSEDAPADPPADKKVL
ncbi:DUF4097 family beta strand repeat-containing protein [Streptomyces sp. NPDC053560]|uniref:DUF4097 family beta strand repeat-containing protein n=1 Tax=Streptomyces sp. NPDC053560 TaxID=3365711 RepID=UPI0037D65EC9